ncbi:hypothetical protein F5B20DRAFT_597443 [Whalleya microplaca]|nr:hypothetical protein F5B20DRAFT_597443 [Whalleya microplaca]
MLYLKDISISRCANQVCLLVAPLVQKMPSTTMDLVRIHGHSLGMRLPILIFINQKGTSHASHPGAYNTFVHDNVSRVGTRGLFVPAYRSPQFFTQVNRSQNPCSRLPIPNNQLRDIRDDDRDVVVKFYHCGNLCFSRDFMVSPGTDNLVSAAVAFLGDCELRNSDVEGNRPNPGYTGLNLEEAHGGYHLHYPDCAGLDPFSPNIEEDWEQVMKIHSDSFPNDLLLVGVGLGEANDNCVESED